MLLLPLALAADPPAPPIVNGEKTDGFAEVVLLRHTTADGSVAFVCTGTLITPTTVLTAAHCLSEVDGYNLTDVRVFSGSVWTSEATERFAEDWEQHPDYFVSSDGSEIAADLGLVYLAEPYDLGPATPSAEAVTSDDVGRYYRYVGWGSSSDTVNDQGYFKRVADIPLHALEGEFMLGYDGENGSATCGGDSGGPVFALSGGEPGALAAVHSFGRDDDGTICAGSTSGDTRVDLYRDWLIEKLPELAPDSEDTGSDTERPKPNRDEDEAQAACSTTHPTAVGILTVLAALPALRRRRYIG